MGNEWPLVASCYTGWQTAGRVIYIRAIKNARLEAASLYNYAAKPRLLLVGWFRQADFGQIKASQAVVLPSKPSRCYGTRVY